MIYNSSIEYPHISPLRWVEPKSDVRYLRKMGGTDTWRVQFLSDNNLTQTFTLKVYSTHGFYITSFTFTKNTLSDLKYYWDAYPDGTTIRNAIDALGIYYLGYCVEFRLYSDTDLWAVSLPVQVESSLDTKDISVWNYTNDHGTVFGSFSWDKLFSMRVEAKFDRMYLKPSGEFEYFMNQMNEPTPYNSNPYSKYLLTIGDREGLSDDMIEQIHWFLACDAVLIDFTHYVRGEITEVVNEAKGTRQLTVELIPATRRQTQNILGEDIYITNEDGNALVADFEEPETDKILVL